MGKRIDAPSNFKEEYMKYHNGKIFMYELEQILSMPKDIIRKRAKEQGLPIVCKKHKGYSVRKCNPREIPLDFKNWYKAYLDNKITRMQLFNKFKIHEYAFTAWRDRLKLPPKIHGEHDKLFYSKECTKIPKNFKEEYMKFYNRELSKSEFLKILNITNRECDKYRNYLNLPIATKLRSRKTPANFKEEYMKYYNYEISNEKLCSTFKISKTTCHKWRDVLNLPVRTHGRDIPGNFKERYMKYYNHEISYTKLKKKLKISNSLCQKWRRALNLPIATRTCYKDIPENFKEEYMKYYNEDILMKDIVNKFNISPSLCLKWKRLLELPTNPKRLKQAKNRKREIPENFKEEYMRFCNNEISLKKLKEIFDIGDKNIDKWRHLLNLPNKKKRFRKVKEIEISENFKEEYMKYYQGVISQEDLLNKCNITKSKYTKIRKKLNLPIKIWNKIHVPVEEFKEEYMKAYYRKITKEDIYKKFGFKEKTLLKLKKQFNLPSIPKERKIPKNFKEEYMNFYNGLITSKGLRKKFNVTERTYRLWRDLLGLPKLDSKKTTIPENFKEEYLKLLRREITLSQICKKFEISERVYARWRNSLNLPVIKTGRVRKVPKDFKEEYMKFYNKELSMEELQEKFKVSNTTCRLWRDLLGLPIVEKCRNRREFLEPINLADEFPDEISY